MSRPDFRLHTYRLAPPPLLALAAVALALPHAPARAQETRPPNDAQEPAEERFDPVHRERSRSILLDGGAGEVFALFEPAGWNLWAGVEREFLFRREGEDEAGTVLRRKVHGHDWVIYVVADHDRRRRQIHYVIFIPEAEAWEMEIRCVPTPDGKTIAEVEYRVTSLSKAMNEPVSDFFANEFDASIDSWGSAINDYLRGGVSRGAGH